MSDMALGGLSSLLATIQGLYPKARVTSGYRGPNNPLTQANPRSMHALGSAQDPRAVDVAPIPGVSFDQYVGSIKNAGVPVAQAFDEQKHPFKWTTGPNWHIGVGQAPVQAAYQPRKPRNLGDVMPSPDLAAQMPVNIESAPVQRQLGDLGGSLPTMETSGHKGLFPGKDWKSILGILADGLTAYGGGQPVFGPALLKRQEQEREQGFDREKLAAQIAAKRSEQPQFLENAMAWNGLAPEQKRVVLEQQDAMNPISVAMPDGPHLQPRTQFKQLGDKRYYSIGGQWYEESN